MPRARTAPTRCTRATASVEENACRRVRRRQLAFIGPPADVIAAMGRIGARAIMQRADCPWCRARPRDQSDEASRVPRNRRVPVLVRPRPAVAARHARCTTRPTRRGHRRGAAGQCAFGNRTDRRLIQRPRHVEISLATTTGRSCTVRAVPVQRQQKVVEESPAPGLTPAFERAWAGGGRRGARVELPRAPSVPARRRRRQAPFYFLEMNTRLQLSIPSPRW
jgi:acetyl/propionyl-CoA carboxylase alpha subunit